MTWSTKKLRIINHFSSKCNWDIMWFWVDQRTEGASNSNPVIWVQISLETIETTLRIASGSKKARILIIWRCSIKLALLVGDGTTLPWYPKSQNNFFSTAFLSIQKKGVVAFLHGCKHKSNETALQNGIVCTQILFDLQRERQFVLLNRGGLGSFSLHL